MYQFQFTYAFQDLLALNRVSVKARTGRRVLVALLRLLLLVVGLFLAVASVMALCSVFRGVHHAIFLAAGLLYLALAVFYHHFNAWHSRRMMVKGMGEVTVTLDEDGIHDHCAKGDSAYPWASVEETYHSRARYFLFVDKKHAVILPERALVQGDQAALNAFLAEKLRREVKEIR